jgi:hypothetical protein
MAIETTKRSQQEIGDYVAYLLVILVGLLGPYLAHGARDSEIYIFGLGMFAFAVGFIFLEVKRHYDLADDARATAKAASPHE